MISFDKYYRKILKYKNLSLKILYKLLNMKLSLDGFTFFVRLYKKLKSKRYKVLILSLLKQKIDLPLFLIFSTLIVDIDKGY